jgi:aldose 1-epimerase
MIPLTGAQYELAAGDYRAVITELGAGLRELHYRGCPVITGYGPDELPPGAAGQLLVPWPNRVDRGQYTAGGSSHQLDLSEPGPGNAIHGLARWERWAAVRQAPDEVLLRLVLLGRAGYPFCLEVEADYTLCGDAGLRLSVTSRNVGARPAPYGLGAHPYLTPGTPDVGTCQLSLPASRWLPADERGIPAAPAQDVTGSDLDFRARRTIGAARLDHAFTGLEREADGRAWARLTGSGTTVALWAGPGYHWLQVFTGDTLGEGQRRRALAVEPMTCPPNALATGTDLITLDPGDLVAHSWGIVVTH